MAWGQESLTEYEANAEYPFGRPHPNAPEEIKDFHPVIGAFDCASVQRAQDGTWQDTLSMKWKFKYIMNGHAVQDEVWRDQQMYAGSIRQYHADSSKWYVTYFSYPGVSTKPGTWAGQKEGEDIVLFMDQTAPNGMEGKSRLTFYEMTDEGFSWKGEWVHNTQPIVYPFWMISCNRISDQP